MSAGIAYDATVDRWLAAAARAARWWTWQRAFGLAAAIGLEMWLCFVRKGMPAKTMAERLETTERKVWRLMRVGAIKGSARLRQIADLAYAMDVGLEVKLTPAGGAG
jgi:hypothetical protein